MKKMFGALLVWSVLVSLCLGVAFAASFDPKGGITVVSREDGSGTRGAFIELLGILKDGKDRTSEEAVIANRTDVVLSSVAGDPHAIGYISMGSLNDSVKALSIGGVAANTGNVKNGTYPISRPFVVATKKGAALGAVAADFMKFLRSKEGQEIVGEDYIKVDEQAPAFSGVRPEGKVVIAGSSSVTPVMEVLREAYLKLNPNAEVEIQMSDSSAGMKATIDGVSEIGMASRVLKESEAELLTGVDIALDGIAVIVNTANPLSDTTKEIIGGIFTGERPTWEEANA